MLPTFMRSIASRLVAWAFSKCFTILRLQPGDVIICYDRGALETLAAYPSPFIVPLIDAECHPGEEHEILRKLSYQEFTKLWNMAYEAYAEEQWKTVQGKYYSHPLRKPSLSYTLTKSQQEVRVESLAQRLRGLLSERISRRQDLIAGKGERQLSELAKRQSKP